MKKSKYQYFRYGGAYLFQCAYPKMRPLFEARHLIKEIRYLQIKCMALGKKG